MKLPNTKHVRKKQNTKSNVQMFQPITTSTRRNPHIILKIPWHAMQYMYIYNSDKQRLVVCDQES